MQMQMSVRVECCRRNIYATPTQLIANANADADEIDAGALLIVIDFIHDVVKKIAEYARSGF
jgi:hypothetical protein